MSNSISNYIRKNKNAFIYSGLCFVISIAMIYLARTVDGFAQWYASTIFPFFTNTIGRLFSPIPFSVFELALSVSILLLVFLLIKIVILAIQKNPMIKSLLSVNFRRAICIISTLFLIFTLTASINYSRTTFADSNGMLIPKSTSEDLIQLSLLLIEDVTELSHKIDLDKNNIFLLDRTDIHSKAIAAMQGLGNHYPQLSGYYPNPKPIKLSTGMSYLGITGIYSPFTLEANYNSNVASYLIPFTICHELTHFKGYMKEDEANFIAYLACRDSSSIDFKYSGTLNALTYTLKELNENVSREEYKAVYDLIPKQIRAEIAYSQYYWIQHTSPVTTVAKAANDQYLQANAQVDGTDSYGRMVDLLLAEYADEINGDVLL